MQGFVICILCLFAPIYSMVREECTQEHIEHTFNFFPELMTYPFNLNRIRMMVSGADDWQICEKHLMPRICLLDVIYGQMLNNFDNGPQFSRNLMQLARLAQDLDEKCKTRNVPTEGDNKL